jgi:hypothetical protein
MPLGMRARNPPAFTCRFSVQRGLRIGEAFAFKRDGAASGGFRESIREMRDSPMEEGPTGKGLANRHTG